MCPPTGIRVLVSIASLFGWRLTKVDAKPASLQTGKGIIDAYVCPPRESTDKSRFLWLLPAAMYGLRNENAKWQVASDEVPIDIGLTQLTVIPQLFYLAKDKKIAAIVAKLLTNC